AVQAISRDDLAAFHEQHLRPDAAILAVVGDLSAAEVLEMMSQLFSGWRRGAPWRLPPLPPLLRPTAPQRAEVRLPGKTQSDIALGAPGVTRGDPGYYDAMMANLIVGQIGMMGRLGESVRERQGMAYYAYSDLRAGLLAGPWWVRAGVNPQNEIRAIESIVEELRGFQRSGPTDEELSDGRSFLIGSLALRLETNAGIAQTLADIELYDLGLDYLVRFPEIVRARTAEGITEAARRFPLDGYTVAIAGPPPAP
ncbi:MAG TPA: pitrilysin family protein, partial [bacterium]|nr:pitrilysin family protein [bacterium]